jgi:hypothetical protein
VGLKELVLAYLSRPSAEPPAEAATESMRPK